MRVMGENLSGNEMKGEDWIEKKFHQKVRSISSLNETNLHISTKPSSQGKMGQKEICPRLDGCPIRNGVCEDCVEEKQWVVKHLH